MRTPAPWILAISALAISQGPASAQAEIATPANPPAGAESLGVEWRSVQTPGGAVLMAVSRPGGAGPFPAIVILHGSHGFARQYVQLAKELSQSGVIAVAVCWFAPGEGPGKRDITPLGCPSAAPRISPHQSVESGRTIEAIVDAVRTLPGVRSDSLAIFGHSRGAGAAWNYILRGGKAQAVILNSAGYPDELINRSAEFDAPVLILHGERDTVGPMTHVQRGRKFEAALRRAKMPVEAVYYRTGEHNSLFSSRTQHDDEVMRMKAFLRQKLQRN